MDLVGGDSSAATTRQFVLQKSRQSPSALKDFGKTYAKLLEDLKERERLYRLDTGAENQLSPREMSRRSAARAGLLLPELDPELEDYMNKK